MRLTTLIFCILIFAVALSVQAETTLDWWQLWTDPSIKPTIEAMVEEFEQANPDIKVNLTDLTWSNGHEKIAIAFASGSGPDVVELGSDWIAQFAVNGHLADLSEHIAADSADYQGWGMATYRDRVYAKPWILGTRVLYVNRDLLKQAGFEEEFLPFSVGDLFDAATAINNLDRNTYGWGSNTAEKHRLYKKFLPFFWSNDAQVFTDDGKYCVVSSMQAINALDFYKQLHDSCGYVSNQRGIEDAFLDGKIGFILSGDWLLKRIELENRHINFNTTIMPGVPNSRNSASVGKSFLGGEFLAVNSASDHQDAARTLVDFITSPENQVRFCKANRSANPSSKMAQKDAYFAANNHLQTFISQIRFAAHPPVDPDWVHIETEIEKAVENVVFGNTGSATALRKAQINIAKMKAK